MNIAEIRQQYPQYEDLSDKELADALRAKFYTDMPADEFYKRVGLQQDAPQQTPQQPQRSLPAELGRQVGLTGRAMAEGVADLAAPFANPIAWAGNKAIEGAEALGLNEPGGFRFPEQANAFSRVLTQAGVPEPENALERGVNFTGRLGTAMAAGPRLDRAVTARMPSAPPSTPIQPAASLDDLSRQFDVPLTAGEAGQSPILQRVDTYLEGVPGVGIYGFRQGQQTAVKRAAGRIVDSTGDAVDDVGATVRASLNRVYQANKDTASRLFDRVDEASRDVGIQVYGQNRQRAAAEILQQQARLARQNAADPAVEAAARKALDGLPMSFAEARALRSTILSDLRAAEKGMVNGSVKPTTVAAMKKLEQGLEADMEEFAKAAGGRVERVWRNANQYYRTRVVPFMDRTIRNASGEDFDSDRIVRTFIKPDARGTAGKLVDRLDLKGKEAVRYGVLRDAFDNAMDESGFFSPQKFRNAINRLGKTRERVFTPQQEAQLQGFSRLAEAAKRAGQYTENPPTGARLVPFASGGAAVGAYAAGGIPAALAGAAGVKTLSVLMTSQRGRALLARAAEYAPDSAQMQNALRAAAAEISRLINEPPEE